MAASAVMADAEGSIVVGYVHNDVVAAPTVIADMDLGGPGENPCGISPDPPVG
jgi:hypothetical protein